MRYEKEEGDEEPFTEPENRAKCEVIESGKHSWIWDYENSIWVCDECGLNEDEQEG